ncbi:MAG: DUF4159 domain-containing protein [Planctomycetes bacterium]|nr:DUF4159 domain-containing protein [Planctomycetota bacterium]
MACAWSRWWVCLAVLAAAPAAGEPWVNPKAAVGPRASPSRIGGGEGVPPLPLPATPLRRSEKRRQPAPPALVGMITFAPADARLVDGRRAADETFPTTQIDIERLLSAANQALHIQYRYVTASLETFSGDPAELPLLYLTGWTEIPPLSEATLGRLRRYLYDGGTLVVHAQCGREAFVQSARRELGRLLPGRALAAIDTDSPLFHACTDIETMRVRKDDGPFRTMPPYLEGICLGCRPAVIFSPIDLSCGWNVAQRPILGGLLYHQADATALGVNIIAVVLANFHYARAFGVQTIYPQQDDPARDRLVLAQLVHEGDWDPTPHALPNLMKHIQANTELNVQFSRREVRAAADELAGHPVLYMTGLRDFTWSDAEVAALRDWLGAGGLLIADAAAGRRAFDVAFRREIARVAGDAPLEPIAPDHPLLTMPYAVSAVRLSPLLQTQPGQTAAPALEGVTLDGRLAVIYSPLSLSNGWEQLAYPYNRGYADHDALRLGVNLIAYGLMH